MNQNIAIAINSLMDKWYNAKIHFAIDNGFIYHV
jgi:hypothetical protein